MCKQQIAQHPVIRIEGAGSNVQRDSFCNQLAAGILPQLASCCRSFANFCSATASSAGGGTTERVNLSEQPGQATASGYIGSGVNVDSVTRSYDELLAGQVLKLAQSALALKSANPRDSDAVSVALPLRTKSYFEENGFTSGDDSKVAMASAIASNAVSGLLKMFGP